MNVAILHCHWERGGVTQVVENHVAALRGLGGIQRLVLAADQRWTGLSARTLKSVSTLSIDDFDYDARSYDAETTERRAGAIADRIEQGLMQLGLAPDDSVLHWHNHGLGKNTSAPEVVRNLAARGWRLLLQIHDFAEDNRPENYARLIGACGAADKEAIDRYLYPTAAQIHYAALTRADGAALRAIGIPAAQTHWLPNSAQPFPDDRPDPGETLATVRQTFRLPGTARWCLYPVRGIRRKNVGEFLLLSRWTAPDYYAGLTLRPTTPLEARSYDRWKSLAGEVAPRARFDTAHHPGIRYIDNLAACDFVISTSVAEGFGMTFLEPWLAGRGVIARRLATVTDDFLASGLQLGKLYDSIPIVGEDAWMNVAHQEYETASAESWATIPPELRPQPVGRPVRDPEIDFAMLTPARQVDVLRRMATDSGYESEIMSRSKPLIDQLTSTIDPTVIDHNAKIIHSQYSMSAAGESLARIYRQLLASPIDHQIAAPSRAGSGVDTIQRVRPFYPCRTEIL